MIVNDAAFGTMSYDAGWGKQEQIVLWGKAVTLRVVAKAYSGQEILDCQRKAYTEFKNRIVGIEGNISISLLGYYKKYYNYISNSTDNIPFKYTLNEITQNRIIELIKVRTLIFDRSGNYGFLCDCAWNKDDGIAIKLNGGIEIGEQDILI